MCSDADMAKQMNTLQRAHAAPRQFLTLIEQLLHEQCSEHLCLVAPGMSRLCH